VRRDPDFLTVEEAAEILRIGRTQAYRLARRWLETDGREGIPCQRIGHLLRVPRAGLEELAGGPVHVVGRGTSPLTTKGGSVGTAAPGPSPAASDAPRRRPQRPRPSGPTSASGSKTSTTNGRTPTEPPPTLFDVRRGSAASSWMRRTPVQTECF